MTCDAYPLCSYGLADAKTRDRQAAILLFFSAALMVVGAVGTLGDLEYDSLKRLWGFTSNGGRGAGSGGRGRAAQGRARRLCWSSDAAEQRSVCIAARPEAHACTGRSCYKRTKC